MSAQSLGTTRRGEFRALYLALKRHPDVLARTPIIYCEGDSWFSTPLTPNILSFLVDPPTNRATQGPPALGSGGLFFRLEKSGDTATSMFSDQQIRKNIPWFRRYDFDLVLLSAGGNDFVGPWLKELFKAKHGLSVEEAIDVVVQSGKYDEVQEAYASMIAAFKRAKPTVPILAHTYAYPQRMGEPAALTLQNIGVVALLKHETGPWITPAIAHCLPTVTEQGAFAKGLLDQFEARVLRPLKGQYGPQFDYVELRNALPEERFWDDEMHPSASGFSKIAEAFRSAMLEKLGKPSDGQWWQRTRPD